MPATPQCGPGGRTPYGVRPLHRFGVRRSAREKGLSAAARRLAATEPVLVIRDWLTPGRTLKILEIGTIILLGALAVYAVVGGPASSIVGVRLRVDLGLLLIVLVSLALQRPFTLQVEFWRDTPNQPVHYVQVFAATEFGPALAQQDDHVLIVSECPSNHVL